MGSQRQIEVRLHPDGTVTGQTVGMKGASCLSALTLLQALIDGTLSDSAFTAEFYEADEAPVQVEEAIEVSNVGD